MHLDIKEILEVGRPGTESRYKFDGVARTYDQWYETPQGRVHDRTQKSDAQRFLVSREIGAHLLDIGCGTGHWSRFFASVGYAVVGVDISPGMIAMARTHSSHGKAFSVADACVLPFEDGCFDVVAAMATLEFVSDPLGSLYEMVRCARAGGRILVGTLNRLAALNLQRVAECREPYVSASLFSPGELRELLATFGQVRMVASDPETIFPERNWHQFDGFPAGSRLDGPFIIAEVLR
jgi:ubiquinone/menaquinone biosynthesis C-methylase UbiE